MFHYINDGFRRVQHPIINARFSYLNENFLSNHFYYTQQILYHFAHLNAFLIEIVHVNRVTISKKFEFFNVNRRRVFFY